MHTTSDSVELRPAGFPVRILYSAALLSVFPGAIVSGAGWIALAIGGQGFSRLTLLVLLALVLFRIYQVFRYPTALASREAHWSVALLRGLAVLVMAIGVVGAAGFFLMAPLARVLFGGPGDSNIAYFVIGLFLSLATPVGWLGCAAYEILRRIGPRGAVVHARNRRHDAVVLVLLLAAVPGLAMLRRAAEPPPCGEGNLTACVATIEGAAQRMIGLPLGGAVHLDSDVSEIALQRRSGSGVLWDVTESPLAALEASGFSPAGAPTARVQVRLEAFASGSAVVLTLVVYDGLDETARFTTRFADAALEQAADGSQRVVVDLPRTAESGRRQVFRASNGRDYNFDNLYSQLRQALGSELDAREQAVRIVRSPRLVATERSPVVERVAVRPRAPQTEERCGERVTNVPSKFKSSTANASIGLYDLTFAAATTPAPHAHMNADDRLVCHESEFWIVSYPVSRPTVRLRRYAADGTLLRVAESTLPVPTEGSWDVVVPESVREADGRIMFDRVVGEVVERETVYLLRDRFELEL